MIKYILHRIPLILKAILSYFIIGFLLVGFLYLFLQSIQSFLATQHNVTVSVQTLFQNISIQYYAICLGVVTIIWAISVYDVHSFFYRIQGLLMESLEDRKLPEEFPLFDEGTTFDDVASHTDSILSLYRSFDTMKTARIVLEVSTIKQLMNVVDEGVLLVNRDRIATHINHNGEQLLRLIPGEIIGEAISRKISNETFLQSLDQALTFDQKVIGKDIVLGDKGALTVNMFPIKDKFGDVVRVLVVIKKREVEVREDTEA